MPRRNHHRRKRTYLPPGVKPKSRKRPREWHHGPAQDERFLDAERRFLDTEGEAA